MTLLEKLQKGVDEYNEIVAQENELVQQLANLREEKAKKLGSVETLNEFYLESIENPESIDEDADEEKSEPVE